MDISDLYDEEIAKIGPVWRKLMDEFSTKTANRQNLDELGKRAHDEFLKIGLVVDFDPTPLLIVDPNTMQAGQPVLTILGRVPGSVFEEEGVPMFDHEKKQFEVLRANDRGEDFLGQKEKP